MTRIGEFRMKEGRGDTKVKKRIPDPKLYRSNLAGIVFETLVLESNVTDSSLLTGSSSTIHVATSDLKDQN